MSTKEFKGLIVESEARRFNQLKKDIIERRAEFIKKNDGLLPNTLYLDPLTYEVFRFGWWPRKTITHYRGMQVMIAQVVNKQVIKVTREVYNN